MSDGVAGLSREMGVGVVTALMGSCGDVGGELEAKTMVLKCLEIDLIVVSADQWRFGSPEARSHCSRSALQRP